MNYWRMQLHPSDPKRALEHAINSLNRGYIGLDFEKFGGDLSTVSKKDLPGQRIYWHFAHTMREGDLVLVIVHHYPFALVEVVGPYNYLKEEPDRTLGVWFRHFRRIKLHGYYADWHSNAAEWDRAIFAATIHRAGRNSATYRLIEECRNQRQTSAPT